MAADAPIWRYLNAITFNKDQSVANEDVFDKEYNPYIINMGLSYHEDCVLAAEVMNERPWLDKKSQFRFLLNTLRPRKRYSQWIKHTDSDDVQAVAEYYGCSIRRARDLVTLHTSEQLASIRSRLDKGGATKRGTKHGSNR